MSLTSRSRRTRLGLAAMFDVSGGFAVAGGNLTLSGAEETPPVTTSATGSVAISKGTLQPKLTPL